MSSWQSVENWFFMSYFLAAKAVPLVAVGSSIVFAVSPWQTVQTIQRAGSTMQFSFAPFFFFFVQSVIYTLYGYTTGNALMGGTAALSAVLGSHYVYVFCKHAVDKTRPVRMLATALTLISVLGVHALSKSPAESQLLIGVPGNILSLLTSASPLLQIKTIVRTRDASCLPFGMSVMNVVAGGVWMVYGLMLHDRLIVLPNMFALTMGLIQVTLILRFPSKRASSSSSGASTATAVAKSLGISGALAIKSIHEKV